MATNLVSDARRRSVIATLNITGVCVCVWNEGGRGREGRWLGSSKQQFAIYVINVEGWSRNAIEGHSSELLHQLPSATNVALAHKEWENNCGLFDLQR